MAGGRPPALPSVGPPPPPPPPPPRAAPRGKDDEDTTPVPLLKAPPGAPKPTAAAGKPGVDIDWDDEDEATQVFDKGIEDTARALLHSAPPPPAAGAPPPPPPAAGAPPPASRAAALVGRPLSVPPPPSVPRAPLPPPPAPAPVKTQPFPPTPTFDLPPSPSITLPQQRSSRGGLWMVIAAVVVIGAGAAAYALMPKKGSLVVSVSGPGGKAIDGVQVYVDGSQRCDASPCQVTDLPRGVHFVKVGAAGYTTTAPKAVKINAGEESAENVELARGSEGSGLKVSAEGAGLRLSVDGKDYGPLPQEIRDLAPGEHTVKIDGGERYESMEKKVTVEADKLFTLEPKLKVKKGLATIKAGANADGAKVLLVSGNERRPVPQLPLRVDITSDKPYSIVATKKGFADYKQSIEFEDGAAERTFVVELGSGTSEADAEKKEEEKEKPSTPISTGPKAPPTTAPVKPPVEKPEAPKPAVASGKGTLNINSIPMTDILLDGKPIGKTPKVGVSVSPGSHTVVFVHPEQGRKAKTVTVEAGKTAAAIVRF
jgi:serine/threonine-protein kinase